MEKNMKTNIYIYICVCVCVCVCMYKIVTFAIQQKLIQHCKSTMSIKFLKKMIAMETSRVSLYQFNKKK